MTDFRIRIILIGLGFTAKWHGTIHLRLYFIGNHLLSLIFAHRSTRIPNRK